MRKPIGKIRSAKSAKRIRRKLFIRKKVNGSSERPRVCVTKSNKNIFVQVVNDQEGKTLFSVQTFGKNGVKGATCNKEGAKLVGAAVADKLKDGNFTNAVFDRAGNKYHGVVAAVAEAIRENGIQL